MKKLRTFTTAAVAGVISLGTVGALAAGASASTPKVSSVNVTHACSKGSLANLQVQREDTGQISIDVGVDMARHTAGVPWKITVLDNGTAVAAGKFRTAGDGSFSYTKLMNPKAGANHVVFRAVNLRTGESCAIAGTL